MRMAAVQAYAYASGKGKKPSWTNALARRHREPEPRPTRRSGSVKLRLLVFKHIRIEATRCASSDGPVGHQGLASRLLGSGRTEVCAAGSRLALMAFTVLSCLQVGKPFLAC